MEPIKLKIDVTKIIKDAMFKGAKGTYLEVIVWPNRGESKYGEIGMITQDLGKDRKEEKSPILGNAFPLRKAEPKPAAPAASSGGWDDSDDSGIPF
jgi:hypothetical protein